MSKAHQGIVSKLRVSSIVPEVSGDRVFGHVVEL